MISKLEQIQTSLRDYNVKTAVLDAIWRAHQAAQIPEKSVDPTADFIACVERARNDLNATLLLFGRS